MTSCAQSVVSCSGDVLWCCALVTGCAQGVVSALLPPHAPQHLPAAFLVDAPVLPGMEGGLVLGQHSMQHKAQPPPLTPDTEGVQALSREHGVLAAQLERLPQQEGAEQRAVVPVPHGEQGLQSLQGQLHPEPEQQQQHPPAWLHHGPQLAAAEGRGAQVGGLAGMRCCAAAPAPDAESWAAGGAALLGVLGLPLCRPSDGVQVGGAAAALTVCKPPALGLLNKSQVAS